MHACLVHITPLEVISGTRTDIRLCTHNDRRVTGLNGLVWQPALPDALTLGVSLWNGDFTAAVAPAGITIPINLHALREAYADVAALYWIGANVSVYVGEVGGSWSFATPFMTGRVTSMAGEYPRLALQVQVDAEPLSANVLTATYAGTGGAEGGADIKNRVKPLAIGWVMNAEPVLIDAANSVYQFSAYGAIEAVTTLYERGASFGASVGDHANYAALVAATIAPGRWATCLASGMVRLGAPAFGVITGDIRGHRIGLTTPRLTGAVIDALRTVAGVSSGLVDSTTMAALDADKPYPVNVLLDSQTTFIEIARQLVLACNWQAAVSLTGKLYAADVGLSGSPVITFDGQGRALPLVSKTEELDVSPPYWRTVLGANRCWRVHTADEIAFQAELVEKGTYSGTTTYREGNIVTSADATRWVYINPSPSAGNAPPSWPTTSNAYWQNLTAPVDAVPAWVLDAATDFNASNNRDSSTPTAPTVLTTGTAIDHTGRSGANSNNTDGSVNISFEWVINAAAGTYDGHEYAHYRSTSSSPYTIGTAIGAEERKFVPPGVPGTWIVGAPSDLYHTFGVRCFRKVDNDTWDVWAAANPGLAATTTKPVIVSAWAQPTLAAENPYRPNANVPIMGDISGTVGFAPVPYTADLVITVRFSFTGALIAGQLFKYQIKRYKGATDVSALATWSVASVGHSATVAGGLLTMTGFGSYDGYVLVTSTYEGIAVEHLIPVVVELEPPNQSIGSNVAIGALFGAAGLSTTTYTVYSEPLAVEAGATGTIDIRFYYGAAAEASGSTQLRFKIQRRTGGGAWSDVANAAHVAVAFDDRFPLAIASGVVLVNTGLTPGTVYEYQILARREAASTATGRFYGKCFAAKGY